MLAGGAGDLWRVIDRFDTAYFTGLDVRVVLNDTPLLEVVGLSYEIMEQVVPVYGYASYTYDGVLRGTRLIRGQFTINFRTPGYLVRLIRRELEGGSPSLPLSSAARMLPSTIQGEVVVDEVFRMVQRGQAFPPELYRKLDELRSYFWGDRRQDIEPVSYPIFESQSGLRLLLIYDDPVIRDSRGVLFQVPTESGTRIETGRSARLLEMEELVGVQILGYSKAVDDSGRNLLEQYQFLARDILPHSRR